MKPLIDRWHQFTCRFSLETRLVANAVVAIAVIAMPWQSGPIWFKVLGALVAFSAGVYLRSSIQAALWEPSRERRVPLKSSTRLRSVHAPTSRFLPGRSNKHWKIRARKKGMTPSFL